ncbi:penicillin acylase family protein [Paenibacillus sp. HJL G12]|uniref:Penicillin acylase family protein n=1 Tax=Paenibacillus dendrobii TaxID=2691084 RepID=A0A7X3IJ44_9BACL|nr:penicillin acylase family protein [Paenibacillus dendrobii]MWV44650.1 penicillin acylase family protein [Paenibacillus dendrobii]
MFFQNRINNIMAASFTRATIGYLTRSQTKTTGNLVLPGLSHEVKVYRDQRGVPHIEAADNHDLYKAQGFVTAQDRLWQMDMMRRLAGGELAEVLGNTQLNSDKLFRTLQLRQSAERSYQIYSEQTITYLKSYCSGVNGFIQQAVEKGRLPLEFKLLKYQPAPWKPVDCLMILKLMSYDMSENWRAETYRYQLAKKAGLQLCSQLFPVYPPEGFVTVKSEGKAKVPFRKPAYPYMTPSLDLEALLSATKQIPDETAGSNAWVLSGKRTKSGSPILANDPHINHSNPSLWYQAHLVVSAGDKSKTNVIGASIPGVPGIALGHNDHIAWGVTNTKIDTQDLYIEKKDPNNKYKYEQEGLWFDAEVYHETIKVKGQPDTELEVLVTRHGPVLSGVLGMDKELEDDKEALALSWTAHQPTTELEALLSMNKATDWKEFRDALKSYQTPVLTFVFASQDDIAAKVAGLVPIRGNHDGLLPVPGWKKEYELSGYIPFDELPELVNPDEGIIVSANNKIMDDRYPYFLSHAWAPSYRADRIYEVLTGISKASVEDMLKLQVDYANPQAELLLPFLLPILRGKHALGLMELSGLDILEKWDRVDEAKQSGPFVFYIWMNALGRIVFEPMMGKVLYARMFDKVNVLDRMIIDANEGLENDWIKRAGGLQEAAVKSYQVAIMECAQLQGRDPMKWEWGNYHRIGPAHPLGAGLKALGFLMNTQERPVGGSNISVGAMVPNRDGSVYWSASWRTVVDLSDIRQCSYDILAPGQSGHFGSRHYQDQAHDHAQGTLFKQTIAREEYQQGRLLRLLPGGVKKCEEVRDSVPLC